LPELTVLFGWTVVSVQPVAARQTRATATATSFHPLVFMSPPP